jgi:hypothetical protein
MWWSMGLSQKEREKRLDKRQEEKEREERRRENRRSKGKHNAKSVRNGATVGSAPEESAPEVVEAVRPAPGTVEEEEVEDGFVLIGASGIVSPLSPSVGGSDNGEDFLWPEPENDEWGLVRVDGEEGGYAASVSLSTDAHPAVVNPDSVARAAAAHINSGATVLDKGRGCGS